MSHHEAGGDSEGEVIDMSVFGPTVSGTVIFVDLTDPTSEPVEGSFEITCGG